MDEADSVSVELALPPTGGVTTEGENDAVTPLGSPEMLRFVALLNPFRLETLTVAPALPP